ncbi:hypothetical protein CUZ56_01822 [Saezia sanguinis]|uniref:Knr4/Smi1-like domain-containing protein n=1 Tax=Saezia sanguinis TaxID=1965230 RepID=A0A433SCS3_9BURK|nr:SMI1/KNR4 family protein [Saezia sanguinis]RUS66542.1 hypothetical protein CUZ56_01822 [Saezia sanguinis]
MTSTSSTCFPNFDLTHFWEDSDYAAKEYTGSYPDAATIASLENELGYKLPAAYIELMQATRNGGIPTNTCFPTTEATSWAEDHIAITGILGIGRDKPYAIGGTFGSQFHIDEWGYPPIGIAICDCPSAGHDLVFLDYRQSGPQGEPEVVHVDQEGNYRITWLAPDFASFIRGLVNQEVFDDSQGYQQEQLETVRSAPFSPLLATLCQNITEINHIEQRIRHLAETIVQQEGFFALHADEHSHLLYGLQFWLYTKAHPHTTQEQFLQAYPGIIALASGFSTGGYAPDFISEWLHGHIEQGQIQPNSSMHLAFTPQAASALIAQFNAATASTPGL